MFIIIGIMLTGMLFGYLLRSKRLTWIHKIITFLIWVLLFQLDNFSNVGQFVITQIVERSEETRVEEEGFQENAGYFLFQSCTVQVNLIDNLSFLLQVWIGVGPVKDFIDF